jgi:hypothetical protein
MAKASVVTSGSNAGWFDNAQAVACESSLRQRYRAACKDFQQAKRAVQGCLNPRRLPVLKEKFERARLYLEEVESEVKRCW